LAEYLLSLGYEVHGIVRRVANEHNSWRFSRIKHLFPKIFIHSGSIENYQNLHLSAKSNFHDYSNLVLECEDGFNSDHNFSIFVSNLPYSKSRYALEWLLQKKFSRAVIMVQKEFSEKLCSNEKHKAISVLANYGFRIKFLMNVKKSNFFPIPKVDSVVILLEQKRIISKVLISTVKSVFSYRRKTLQNILKQFGLNSTSKKRLDELSGDEIIKIAQKIVRI